VIQSLAKTAPAVSSALAQTSAWAYENGAITAGVESGFLLQQLLKDGATVAARINDIWGPRAPDGAPAPDGKPVRFAARKTETAAPPAAPSEKTYPEPVEWLRKTFKGTVTEER
jgi:hypothetical protein